MAQQVFTVSNPANSTFRVATAGLPRYYRVFNNGPGNVDVRALKGTSTTTTNTETLFPFSVIDFYKSDGDRLEIVLSGGDLAAGWYVAL